MNRYNKSQKDKITQFRNVTGASEKIAIDCLKVSNWSVEPAIDYFYASGLSATVASSNLDTKAIEALYQRYKEKDDELIGVDGITKFCEELGVEPADIVMLVISYHMNAATMCEFTHDEFLNGFVKMGVDSIDKLQKKLPELRAELKQEDKFREVYNYAYNFSREKGQKCVQLDSAVGMWQLLFSEDRAWPLIDDWCTFLQKHHNRAISKDTWTQLLDFSKSVKADFSNYDENSAWPYLLDEFVEYMQKQKEMES